jgi:hypothetical protein
MYVQAGTGTVMTAPFDSQRCCPAVEDVLETGSAEAPNRAV